MVIGLKQRLELVAVQVTRLIERAPQIVGEGFAALLEDVEEVVVAPERDDEHEPEHDEARDHPIAQLGQVLDERGLLAVVEPADARQPCEEADHRGKLGGVAGLVGALFG